LNNLGSGYAWVVIITMLLTLGVLWVVGYSVWYDVFSYVNNSYSELFEEGTTGRTLFDRIDLIWRFVPILILFSILIWAVLYTIRSERKEVYYGY